MQVELNMSFTHKNLYKKIIASSFPQSSLSHLLGQSTPDKKRFGEDVIILSCTRVRLHANTSTAIPTYAGSFFQIDNSLVEYIQDCDRELAKKIREYYSKKIVVWQLKGKPLTSFRMALAELLSGPGTDVPDALIGVAYRLPDFYNYDSNFESLKETSFRSEPAPINGFVTRILKPVFSINKSRPGNKITEYWFELAGRNQAAKISVLSDNPLRPIWNRIYDDAKNNNECLVVNGKFNIVTAGEVPHYDIQKWDLITESNK